MTSCFGLFGKSDDDDRAPLLPQYHDDTELQRRLHQKLHTYQMFRAISQGYMPSTEQIIINLRTIMASDVLNPDNPDLSQSGRRLVKYAKTWLQQFMDLLLHKNARDQIQDLLWFLSKSKVSVDVDDIAARAQKSKAKADTAAAYQSLKNVGSLLLTNSDFRIFLSDLNVIGREVFRDSAFTLSNVAEEVGKKIEPAPGQEEAVAKPGEDGKKTPPTTQELGGEVADISKVVTNGTAKVAQTAAESAEEKLAGDEGKTLLNRLKQAVFKLRERNDYSESVSTLSLLLKRYAMAYSRVAEDVVDVARRDLHENEALDRAMHNMWIFVKSFGDTNEWERCESLLKQVMTHSQSNPDFENLMIDTGNSLQKLLTDPEFFDNAAEKFNELRGKSQKAGKGSDLSKDAEALISQIEVTLKSVLQDEDIHNLIQSSMRIFKILSPLDNQATNPELLQDGINVFVPLLIAAVQYVPIPRVEISTPEADILLENLIIEPGKTVNQTSFLPYRLKVETYNDLEIRKAKFKTTTATTNLMTVKIDGLSFKAEEIGFWLRAHKGLLRLADEGIASFALDEKGIDIHFDVEICKEKLEQILTLKAVRVHIHKLNYQMRKSKFSWFGWLLKPLLRPIVRKTMEKQLATALANFFHSANRELVYARERLRATRISDPNDLMTFFKAVTARLTPDENPDLYTRVGVAQPGKGVFKNVYAPGSIVKVWNEQASRATERIEDFEEGGWRNEIFDTHVQTMT
ncbi:hypothetical protein CLAFUW4_09577 [Fulvia fulva]|uniref:HAM1-like N-terminal domain-containing protein n=1 Tax=Passalora fulva TaxID=5499 RepID=A0A9Q8PGH5_PASFU|nr:uncharacterized protein CLAFUR5_09672 [Fulvia fulva]KAK4613606.1 hypothetical protein CLAFUR4_09582 [Fulvia fulva]KAK4615086.1 hypothetical protein CLAFUR0_09573 [Fulvia fulva]UJO22080.1 hypothetical protein CLAFUR5_09672 [Fulvia fulva]WPV20151.1 hypothetical protein CLAFUW4_09577 [Fulvia fulva]WPV35145.1 hypothetical protein CLAFUW7_09578 [Fulvia fulva]